MKSLENRFTLLRSGDNKFYDFVAYLANPLEKQFEVYLFVIDDKLENYIRIGFTI